MKAANESLDKLNEKLNGRGSKRFFFDQDNSCHWYMIPIVLRKRWKELTQNSSDENDEAIADEFDDFRTNSGISHISFISPMDEV